MQTVSLDDAQKNLVELVHQLPNHGELVIVEANRPVARLSRIAERPSLSRLNPSSVGQVLQPFPSPDDDLLDEMTQS